MKSVDFEIADKYNKKLIEQNINGKYEIEDITKEQLGECGNLILDFSLAGITLKSIETIIKWRYRNGKLFVRFVWLYGNYSPNHTLQITLAKPQIIMR